MRSPDPANAVADVLQVLKGTSISEIEVEWGDGRVRVARDPMAVAATPPSGEVSSDPEPSAVVVSSPYVGVYHRVAGAELPDVGERVNAGQTLAEVATLTIRNPVTAPVEGTLVEAYGENGMPVEYGQPLFVIDTTAVGS